MDMFRLLLMATIGGFTAFLSNKGIAVFHDGVRPIYPEEMEGRMSRSTFLAMAFALSIGFILGFGIPFSVGSTVIIAHAILLGTDLIGIAFPKNKMGTIGSIIAGAVYGIGISVGLQILLDLITYLPIDFTGALSSIGDPILVLFSLFPALVVGTQYGMKNGIIAFTITIFARQLAQYYGIFQLGEATVSLFPDGISLMVGMIVLMGYAINEKQEGTGASSEAFISIFAERMKRIRKNMIYLCISGGLISLAAAHMYFATDPVAHSFMKDGKISELLFVNIAYFISFMPLVGATSMATGVYSPSGMTLIYVGATICAMFGVPWLAFFVGAGIMALEILSLERIAKFLDHYPGIKKCSDLIRTNMSKVLELSILIGSMVAANTLAPSVGYLFIGAFYLFNRISKKPITEMAVGAVGIIIFGILLNGLYLIGLFKI